MLVLARMGLRFVALRGHQVASVGRPILSRVAAYILPMSL